MNEEIKVTMSPTIGAIAAALAKAQAAMKPATKDATNPHFKNRYASLASCVEALHPMHENGIAIVQPPALHGAEGVCVATLLIHSSGEWIRGELYMPATKKDPQGFGSALSYARRYCLAATTGLATDDDDDAEQASRPGPRKAPAPTTSEGTIAQLATSIEDARAYRDLCDRVDGAEAAGPLNAVAVDAVRARKDGRISERQLASIKDAVQRKRGLIGGSISGGA